MPGAGLFGHRAGVLEAAAAAPEHADDQQPPDPGRQHQYASPEAARVDHGGRHFLRQRWPRGVLADLEHSDAPPITAADQLSKADSLHPVHAGYVESLASRTSVRNRLPILPSAVRGADEIRTTDNSFEEAARIASEDLNDHSGGFSGWLDPIKHHRGPTLSASGCKLNQGC
jgi:hypothetical protein